VPTVLRLGGLDVARLREVLGTVEVHQGGTAPLPSPGLARRHYAPKALVQLLDGRAALEEELERLMRRGRRVGVLSFGPAPDWGQGIESESLPDVPAPYAARLYAAMHAMDAAGVRELLIEAPPATEPWAAVRDRLKRATAD
jgi:L-threonylcarbamoyladenylate synthase